MARFLKIQNILLLALVLRLYNVTAPLIGTHSWRQTDTAAMARNYYEHGMNIFYPQIDWGGDTAGYVECEFPLYSYFSAVLYSLFGFSETWGRLLSIVFSIAGIYYLYRLVRDLTDTETALWSSFFAAVLPLNVFFGRAFMPEPAMLTFSIIGVYFFYRWTTDQKTFLFIVSAVSIAIACLLKLPALYLGLPLSYLAWLKFRRRMFHEPLVWLYALIVLSLVSAWYYHAHQIRLDGGSTFGIWEYGSDKWGNWELVFSLKFWNGILFQSLAEKHFTWPVAAVFIGGLFLKRNNEKERLFDFWLIAIMIYIIIVARGNYVHSYYQLPFMVPAVVFVGKVFARYFKKETLNNYLYAGLAVSIILMFILGIVRYNTYMKYENPDNSPEYMLARKIRTITPDGTLFAVLDMNDPTILYLSGRKGWHVVDCDLNNDAMRKKIKSGARYFAGLKRNTGSVSRQDLDKLLLSYRIMYNDDDMFIAGLDGAGNNND